MAFSGYDTLNFYTHIIQRTGKNSNYSVCVILQLFVRIGLYQLESYYTTAIFHT